MKISQLFLGLVACSTAFAYAGIDGISSNESNIKIGAAANASHPGWCSSGVGSSCGCAI